MFKNKNLSLKITGFPKKKFLHYQNKNILPAFRQGLRLAKNLGKFVKTFGQLNYNFRKVFLAKLHFSKTTSLRQIFLNLRRNTNYQLSHEVA